MGIIEKTIVTTTCDFCNQQLDNKPDQEIRLFYSHGYECDQAINIKIKATMQWQPDQIVCKKCLIKYMKKWIKEQEDGNQ